ncbi:MAG: aminotransferase class IV [Deltaproteobacteria bacterium]|nr:aminotransferase class IV [Deltaproteobacteria bacterium]
MAGQDDRRASNSLPERGISPPERVLWIDGRFVPWEDATVHVLSHSLQRGSLIFDYMSVHATSRGSAIFRLREHTERFRRSAELVGLPLVLGLETLMAAVVETVRANPGAKAVKMSAYLPSIEVDVVPQDPRLSVAIAAYDPWEDVIRRNPGEWQRRPSVKLWVEKNRRNRREDILAPQAKVAANYTSPMFAKWAARRRGYDEVLLVDEEGFVAETPTANLFWVDEDGVLRTPPERLVLLGVTRLSILELAKHDGVPCAETPVRPEELMGSPEVFLTGTVAGVWPVESIDDQPIGDAVPGPVSARLRERFIAVSNGEDPAFHHWLTLTAAG